eukprot:2837204-Heterocapsa_arctica.AAC.1
MGLEGCHVPPSCAQHRQAAAGAHCRRAGSAGGTGSRAARGHAAAAGREGAWTSPHPHRYAMRGSCGMLCPSPGCRPGRACTSMNS